MAPFVNVMNELDDALLNEYLDGTLDAEMQQAVATQLADDPAAQARLAELTELFTAFAEMEEVPLTTDLSTAVLHTIQAEKTETASNWVGWLPLLQLMAAGLLIVVFWATLRDLLANGRDTLLSYLPTIQIPDILLKETVQNWLTAVGERTETLSPQINLATSQWLLLVGIVLIVWLLGNRLLFTNPIHSNGGSHG